MKSIIITGASKGIGAKTALLLANKYEYMAIISRNSDKKLNEVQKMVSDTGCTCHMFEGDVSDYSFMKTVINTVISEAGQIDALINNAGISVVGLFTDMSFEEWNNIMSTNLTSIYNSCHLVVPHMIHQKYGKIINISSVWGLCGASCEVAYSTTKGAINSFTKALAKELAPSNISVNAIAFGAIDTTMNEHLDDFERAALEDEIPYGKMATPEEAAICIEKLLDMPNYLTGDIIKFDGGWI